MEFISNTNNLILLALMLVSGALLLAPNLQGLIQGKVGVSPAIATQLINRSKANIIDIGTTLIIKVVINVISISQTAFDWVYNMMFGAFNGIIPSSPVGGTVISMKFFRYIIIVLMPPFGILVTKGLYGWFSVLICMIITYVNFMAGIIYAFVITARNRYADQYEEYAVADALSKSYNKTLTQTITDTSAIVGTLGFVILLFVVFYFVFSFF